MGRNSSGRDAYHVHPGHPPMLSLVRSSSQRQQNSPTGTQRRTKQGPYPLMPAAKGAALRPVNGVHMLLFQWFGWGALLVDLDFYLGRNRADHRRISKIQSDRLKVIRMARRTSVPSAPQHAQLTPETMRMGIRRLRQCIERVEAFDPAAWISKMDELAAVASSMTAAVESALGQTFGNGTVEYRSYTSATNFSWPISYIEETPAHEIVASLQRCKTSSLALLREAVSFLEGELELAPPATPPPPAVPSTGKTVFLGHGRSPAWRELKDLLRDQLHLTVDEFNSVSPAGIPTVTRLEEILAAAGFAFLVMTAEDEQADGKVHARLNVVHEAGLFQGRLGFRKAIILLEDSCEEFSNVRGLGQIRFPVGNIRASFEDIRAVLVREEIVGV